MDISTDIREPQAQAYAPESSYREPAVVPPVPPPYTPPPYTPPAQPELKQPRIRRMRQPPVSEPAATAGHRLMPAPAAPPRASLVAPSAAAASLAAGSDGPGSALAPAREPKMYVEGDAAVPESLRDFPCALRNFKKAQVTRTCEIDCEDDSCSKGRAVCAAYVECHALVLKGLSGGGGVGGKSRSLAKATAVLKTDSAASRDGSLERLTASKWWGSPAMANVPRPRVYVVASYGGCGSKMMAGWLSQLPNQHKTHVFHFHDRSPPGLLRHLPPPPPPVNTKTTTYNKQTRTSTRHTSTTLPHGCVRATCV